jgi:parallel beta-helix repeat protein
MFHKFLSHVFSIPLILFAFNINAESIRWELNNSPIFIDSNVVVMAGDVLSIDAGAEIQFAKNVVLNIEGKIELIGQGEVTLTSFSSEKWHGLSVNSDEVFTLSNLHISNARIGIKLTSSPNVTVSNNIIDNNDTGISLHADDGARSNVNSITSNVIQNNDIGLSAMSTGADIQNNLIANNRSYGINLSGRSCGGGTACGWQSLIQNNLISGSEVGVGVFGHHLLMNRNDIYNTTVGIYNRKLNGTSYNVTDTNILGWAAFAFVNGLANSVDAGDIWLGQPGSKQSICDVDDNVILGNVAFFASNNAFPTTHNYVLPTPNPTETQAAHYLCPQPERIINDFSAVSLSAGLNQESTFFLDFNIDVSTKFSNKRAIQVLYWPVGAEQTWITLTRDNGTDIFSKQIMFPDFVKSGVYEIREIVAVDNSGSEIRIDDIYLKQGGYDYRTVIDNKNADDDAPELRNMLNSAPYFDDVGQIHIDFSLSASDNVSGLNSIFVVELKSPTGKTIQKRGVFAEEGLLQTSADLDFVLPKYSASGDYTVNTVRLYDLAGNVNYSQQLIIANLDAITIDNPNADNVSPTLESVSLSSSFDLLAKRPLINISVSLLDDVSGVKSSFVSLRAPNGGLLDGWMINDIENSSDVTAPAQFTKTFSLMSDYKPGDYVVIAFCNTDEANNERCYYKDELKQLQFQDSVNVNYVDTDTDGIPDLYDVFPLIPIGGFLDSDGDGAPDECGVSCRITGMEADEDDDNDGILDVTDALPLDPLESLDTDLDGVGNNADNDDDNDGLPDVFEGTNGLNPLDAFDSALDKDGDGLSNYDEFRIGTNLGLADTDGDGVSDAIDNYPLAFNEPAPTLYSGQLTILPDLNDDGIAEIGILKVISESGQVALEVLNGQDQSLLNTVTWSDNYEDSSLTLHLIPDMNGNGFDEVGLFGIQDRVNNEGKPQVFVRDLQTGNKVGDVYNWVANWKEVSALVLDDMSGDGLAEIAIQGRFADANRPQLVVKVGNTNRILSTYSYPDLFVSPQYYQHSDINGDGVAEIVTFGRLSKNNKIQAKIASGLDAGNKMKAYNFPDKWDNISWHRLDDSNGDGQDDWGMFGTLREDGRPQLVNKDGVSPAGALRIFAWPAAMQNAQFFRIPDMNNDGVDEVAAAGRRSNNGRYQFQVQDGTDRNVLLANHNLNLNLESVTYHVLPDLSGDAKVEVGFMGINAQGDYELVIRHGDTINGEFVTYNLGSDWQNAPDITSLGDADVDGLPDLLIHGQNAIGEQLIITSL